MPVLQKSTFKGGVHVPDMKALSSGEAIVTLPAPERVFISVQQHIGKPAAPVVAVGDHVKKGQLIAAQDGFISANIYSSVSGDVEAIKPIVTNAGKQTHIVIKNDFTDEETLLSPIDENDGDAIAKRIGEAGLVGMGGAGFPTFVKVTPKDPIDILLINAAECEPYLTCDHRVLLERTEEFVQGARLAAKALKGAKIYVGIEDNKPDAIEKLSTYDDINVVPLRKKYPQGGEKQLIFAVTGRKVGVGKLPATTGVCVLNVQTARAVYRAVVERRPLYQRVLTVTGKGIVSPKNLEVLNGTPFSEILAFCGGMTDNARKAVAGGPMMGRVLSAINGYAKKTDSGLLILAEGEANELEPSACINCSRCAKACPMFLMPMYMDLYTLEGKYDRANDYGVMNCIECGACAYVCPAKRDLVGSIQYCKKKLREMSAQGGK